MGSTHSSDPLMPDIECGIMIPRQPNQDIISPCKCNEERDLRKGEDTSSIGDISFQLKCFICEAGISVKEVVVNCHEDEIEDEIEGNENCLGAGWD
jgi:hypothetical protein